MGFFSKQPSPRVASVCYCYDKDLHRIFYICGLSLSLLLAIRSIICVFPQTYGYVIGICIYI